jgi:hypothetical protein
MLRRTKNGEKEKMSTQKRRVLNPNSIVVCHPISSSGKETKAIP